MNGAVEKALVFVQKFGVKLNRYRAQHGRDATRGVELPGWPDESGARPDERGFGSALDDLDAVLQRARDEGGEAWATGLLDVRPLYDIRMETLRRERDNLLLEVADLGGPDVSCAACGERRCSNACTKNQWVRGGRHER